MGGKVLLVDDEPNALAGYARQLRGRCEVETAAGGAEGLAALAARGPFAVVVSDLRMPGIDGIQFLGEARERHPDTVRVLLTGYADVRQAIEAVNRGAVFRFLTKPCPPATLAAAVDAALAQHRLVTAERELLERTLRGSVQVLGEVLALVNPAAFGRAVRVQRLVRDLSGAVPGADAWEVDVAAVLSQLGWVAIPERILEAVTRGAHLPPEDQRRVDAAPAVARDLIRPIPRLEKVAAVLAALERPVPHAGADALPPGAGLLRVAFDYDALTSRGVPAAQAVEHLRSRDGWYAPDVLAALGAAVARAAEPEERQVLVGELIDGMVMAEDVFSDGGVLLLGRGHPVTDALKHRLEAMTARGKAPRRFRVLLPRAGSS